MKKWHKILAVGIVVIFLVMMVPLTEGAAPTRTTTPTLKVVTGSAHVSALDNGQTWYLPLPAGKIVKLHVSIAWGELVGSTTYSSLYFLYPTDPTPQQGDMGLPNAGFQMWDFSASLHHQPCCFEAVVNTNCTSDQMPHFVAIGTMYPQFNVAWWAEYYE